MGFFKKLRKRVVKVGRKAVTVQAGVVTAGLVKPQVLGIRSKQNQRLFDNVGKVTKVAAVGTGLVLSGAGVAGVGPLAGVLSGVKGALPSPSVTTSLGKTLQTFVGAQAPSTQVVRNAMESETPLLSTFDPVGFVAGLPGWVKVLIPSGLVLWLVFRLGRR